MQEDGPERSTSGTVELTDDHFLELLWVCHSQRSDVISMLDGSELEVSTNKRPLVKD